MLLGFGSKSVPALRPMVPLKTEGVLAYSVSSFIVVFRGVIPSMVRVGNSLSSGNAGFALLGSGVQSRRSGGHDGIDPPDYSGLLRSNGFFGA